MPLTRPLLRAGFLWGFLGSQVRMQHSIGPPLPKRWMLGQELFTRTMNQSDITNTRTPSNAPA